MNQPVSPELAEKALQADVRNTLTDVAQGGTLPAGKRQLFLDVVIGGAAPKEIVDARRAALLRRFAQGGRLSKEELAEIADFMPANHCHAVTEGAYRRTYVEYEAIYHRKERTILWWVKQGKHATNGPDLPPLDSPKDMPAWWERVMSNKQKCPDNILAAARADNADVVVPVPVPIQRTPLPSPASAPMPRGDSPDVDASTGFEGNLRNLRQQVAIAYQELIEAQQATPRVEAAIEQARRRWLQLDSAAQTAEAKAPDILEKLGRFIDRETLAPELGSMLSAVNNATRSLYRRLKAQLLKATDEAEEDAIWQRGVDEMYEELQSSGYSAPFTLISS